MQSMPFKILKQQCYIVSQEALAISKRYILKYTLIANGQFQHAANSMLNSICRANKKLCRNDYTLVQKALKIMRNSTKLRVGTSEFTLLKVFTLMVPQQHNHAVVHPSVSAYGELFPDVETNSTIPVISNHSQNGLCEVF